MAFDVRSPGAAVVDFGDGVTEFRTAPPGTTRVGCCTWGDGAGVALTFYDSDGAGLEVWMIDFGKPEPRWPTAITFRPA